MNKLLVHMIIRAMIVIVSIVLQFYLLYLLFFFLKDFTLALYIIFIVISIFSILYIVLQDMKPDLKLSWIVSIVFVPFFGGLIYLVFRKRRNNKKDEKLYKEIEKQRINIANASIVDNQIYNHDDSLFHKISSYLLNNDKYIPFVNTKTKYYKLGDMAFKSMVQELNKANKFIFLEYFIIAESYMWDTILEILERKVKEGVDVRVIYDDMGCIPFMPMGLDKRLKSKGIKCLVFNKVNHLLDSNFNNRNHRKLMIIDGNVGYTGGMNISDNYINIVKDRMHYKDGAVMLKGEAVYSLTIMFLSMWGSLAREKINFEDFAPSEIFESDGIVQPFSDTPLDNENIAETVYKMMINNAKEEIYIMTPYVAPGHDIITDLSIAAKSGIKVILVVPEETDNVYMQFLSRTYYEKLINNGIRIYEYTKGFTHAKMVSCDNETALIGTINLNLRSFNLNYENAVVMHGSSAVKDIKKDFEEILEDCIEITNKNLPKTKNKFLKALTYALLRIFSPII